MTNVSSMTSRANGHNGTHGGSSSVEKLLPQNVDAEAGLLGSLLIDPEVIVAVAEILQPGDFYREAHRTVYQAALDLYESGGPADFITLCDELGRWGKLEELGGTAYIGSLANNVPTSRNALHYARIIERTAILRRLIHAAGQIAAVAYNEPKPDVAMEQAFALLHNVSQQSHARRTQGYALSDVIDTVLADYYTQLDGQPIGLMTGLAGLDGHTAGVRGGELVYVCGRPGMAKTSLAAAIAVGAALGDPATERPGVHVSWFTLEMNRKQQVNRLIAMQAGINTRIIRAGFRRPDGSGDEALVQAAAAAAETLRGSIGQQITLYDTRLTIEALGRQLSADVAEHGTGLALVDYFGLLGREERHNQAQRVERMTEISAELKQLALDLDIPIVCLAQLNREVTRRADPRPELSDIRETGGTEQDADWVWALHRPAYYDATRAQADTRFAEFAELSVLKARDGESRAVIPLRFESQYTRFTDWPEQWPWPADPTRQQLSPQQLHAKDALDS